MWHVITCEYPPQIGGVADFSRTVASALSSAGEVVHVWSPAPADGSDDAVVVHPLEGGYRVTALGELDRALDAHPAPRRLFVQWVPHGYGYKSLNVPFCLWVRRRARQGDIVDLMVHEPYLPFDARRVRQNVGAAVHRGMLKMLVGAATRVWVSTPSFLPAVRRLGPRRILDYWWLPIPSPVAPVQDAAAVASRRADFGPGRPLVGFFGTANPLVSRLLGEVLEGIRVRRPDAGFVLLGTGTDTFAEALIRSRPALAPSIIASGTQSAREASLLMQCCDLFVQPYPDGASTRRTTLMALLQHGRPVVTNVGSRTESFWPESGSVRLVPEADASALADAVASLMDNPAERARLAEQARSIYRSRFDVTRTLAALLGPRAA